MSAAGRSHFRHLTLNLLGPLQDGPGARACFLEALRQSGASMLRTVHWDFEPQGTTIVCLLSESHASMHTWPEAGYAMLDFFSCSPEAEQQFRLFIAAWRAQGFVCQEVHISRRPIPVRGAPATPSHV